VGARPRRGTHGSATLRRMPPIKTYPAWRKGWPWTLIKCVTTLAVTVAAATSLMLWLLRDLVGRLPGWLPSPVVERLFQWLLKYVWVFGPLAGLALGLVMSLGIVVYDAKRGRLTRVK
jgi:hypothetical protein